MRDARLYAPAVQRNRDVIRERLRDVLPSVGLVLEVASGTGEHAVHLASAFPGAVFQPTDHDPAMLRSIDDWALHASATNLRPALPLDASSDVWPLAAADAVLCINMVHIAPWSATVGLLHGAARILPAGAPLVLYGPFHQAGVALTPGNEAFDHDLQARDPAWGLRNLEDIAALADAFAPPCILQMPANNLLVVFHRRAHR